MLCLGLMSGTSMDGIDAAIIETDGTPNNLKILKSIHLPYPKSFSLQLKALEFIIRTSAEKLISAANYSEDEILNLSSFDFAKLQQHFYKAFDEKPLCNTLSEVVEESTKLHILAAKEVIKINNLKRNSISIIGYHGQTFFHRPELGISIILGNHKLMHKAMGIHTAFNFRKADIAGGGQGAPLAPIYHLALVAKADLFPAAVVNCGGIANISLVINDNENNLIGFDCGPGNNLIDRLVRLKTNGQEQMDFNGIYSSKGIVNDNAFKLLCNHAIGNNFLTQNPPKSLDVGDLTLPTPLLELSIEDACATLCFFTAHTIVEGLKLSPCPPRSILLAGGGWKNPTILENLKSLAKLHFGDQVKVLQACDAGFNSDSIEAELMAYLAARTLMCLPITFPGTTGVATPLCGGEVS